MGGGRGARWGNTETGHNVSVAGTGRGGARGSGSKVGGRAVLRWGIEVEWQGAGHSGSEGGGGGEQLRAEPTYMITIIIVILILSVVEAKQSSD